MAFEGVIFRRKFNRLRALTRLVALGVACLTGAESAWAQSAVCRQIESELASLASGGGGNARAAAQARARLGQVQNRMAAIGCNQRGFLFGPQPPAECAGLRAQAASYSAQINAASPQAGGGARRAQLVAALDANNCRAPQRQRMDLATAPQPAPQPPRPRGFLEALFGGGQQQAPAYATETRTLPPVLDPELERKRLEDEKKKVALGGNMPICVRTCDGFFFPVNYQGAGVDDQYEDVCQASCPAASTELYWMRAGADLDTAVSEEGKAYSAMPNAFRYRQAYDPACTCKKPGETWGVALRQADQLIRDGRNDITVTQERSDEMARPLPPRELRGVRNRQAATQVPDAEVRASSASVPARRSLATDAGETREIDGRNGERRAVRVLTPDISTESILRNADQPR